MSLWKVAWRSIQQRALVSTLTVISMGLGVALVVAVLVVYGVVEQSFHRGGDGYDLIVGAKGGKEQLVLNSVFYLSQPIGNIPYSFYEELREGRYAGYVETAVPLCMGHTYQGFRVVGTTPEMFSELRYQGNKKYKFAAGENFKEENHFDAVLGAIAANRIGYKIGEKIKVVHGGEGGRTHQEEFRLVGILEPTGTPVDRAVFVNMMGFFDIHGAENYAHEKAKAAKKAKPATTETSEKAPADKHDAHDKDAHDEHDAHHKPDAHDKHDAQEEHSDHAHDHDHSGEPKEVTAVLVCVPKKLADAGQTSVLASVINRGKIAQAVEPVRVINDLFEGIVGKLQWILLGMAVLTVIVAGIAIMVSIYNSMSDRRHEIAVMRALGASRFTVMTIILLESILLSLMGGVAGLLLGHGATSAFSPLIADWTGVVVGIWQFQLAELILVPGLIVLASAVGYLPALSAYRTDVAKSLITTP